MANRFVVRYGVMRHVGEYQSRGSDEFRRGSQVMVRSNRGTEWGEILCEATQRTAEYLGKTEVIGKILRVATPEDERQRDEVRLVEQTIFADSKRIVAESGLPMQVIDVEKVFGGERIVIYYLSETRVDFRELVKSLTKHFGSRVEMRQLGIRDEAKLLADYGDCGKPVCCSTHLQEMPPVSMKMVKAQKATLDPTKISGRCGRLKCCLRYEYETYESYRKELPKVGKWVLTKQGKGRVLSQEILAQKLLVSYEDNRRVMIDATDVLTVVSAGGTSGPDEKNSSAQ